MIQRADRIPTEQGQGGRATVGGHGWLAGLGSELDCKLLCGRDSVQATPCARHREVLVKCPSNQCRNEPRNGHGADGPLQIKGAHAGACLLLLDPSSAP